jgi:hypothetical protein
LLIPAFRASPERFSTVAARSSSAGAITFQSGYPFIGVLQFYPDVAGPDGFRYLQLHSA